MIKKSDNILVICAHPDDETLGLGGMIALHAKKGGNVFVLIFATGQFARDDSEKGIEIRRKQGEKACSILGVKEVQFLGYDDQKLDTMPVITLIDGIEKAIKKWKPKIVFTHYWEDANQDHRKVFEATLIACRPTPSSTIDQIICYETPSSTEWGSVNHRYSPNMFVDISSVINKKIEALQKYKDEMNKYPHPRSKESITNRAKYWGSSVGIDYAEAFVNLRTIVRPV